MKNTPLVRIFSVASALFLAGYLTAHASDADWATQSGNWSTGSNWTPSSAPGSTNSTTNTDTASFYSGIGSSVTIDLPNQNIGSIFFGGNVLYSDSVGNNGGNFLLLSSGGSVTDTQYSSIGADQAIYAPLVLEPVNATSNGTYTFANNATGLGGLYFSGNISGGTTTGTITLNLTGTSNGHGSQILGTISNGNASSLILVVNTSGTQPWILSGTNSYTGGTTINAGTLQVGNNGLSGNLGTGDVLNNGALVYDRSDSITESRLISGSGSVRQIANATLTLSGANTYSGGTIISNGTVQLSGSGTLGNSMGALTFNSGTVGIGRLDLNGTSQGIGALIGTVGTILNSSIGTTSILTFGNGAATGGNFAGIIENNSGTGGVVGVVKTGTGTQILTGNNTYTGGTTINSGTLQIGNSTSTGSLGMGGVVDNGILAYKVTTGLTEGNAISGSGSVQLSGLGTVTLTGTNTYIGGTNLNAGVLALGSSGAIGTTGTISFGGGSLRFTSANTTDYSSRFSAAANQLYSFDTNGQSVTLAGNLTSSGGALNKIGSGTLILTGSNTYTGGTFVSGGTLQINGSGTLGNASGSLTIYSGGTVDLGGTSQTQGSVVFNGGTLQNGIITAGSYSAVSSTPSIDGANLSGSAGLTISGSSQLIVTGQSSYTGGTTMLGSGSLQVGNGGTIGNLGTGGISGSTGSNLIYDRSDSITESNVISGTLMLAQMGGGTLILTGTNTFNGSIAINSGAVNIQNSAALGSTSNSATVNSGGALQIQGNITANNLVGGLSISGSGISSKGAIENVSGNNTISALVRLTGAASIGSDSGTLTLSNPFNSTGSGNALTLTGAGNGIISNITTGSGSLTKIGSGTWTLYGTSTYTGGTNINGGVLSLGSSGAIGTSGTISFGGGTLQYTSSNITDYSSRFATAANQLYSIDTNGQSVTLAGNLTSNGGSLTKIGSGTLTLTGNNTYTGSTTINNGALSINSVASVGSAQPLGKNNTVTFAGASSSTAGVLQYTGGTATLSQNLTVSTGDYGVVDNTGGGVLTLSGTLSKNGSVLTLAGGKFVVSGTITGSSPNSDLDIGSTTYPGSATVGLTTSNSYNGPTVITDGSTLLTGVNNALPTATPSAITLGASSDTSGQTNTLDLLGTTQTVNSLTSTGSGTNQVISSNGTASGTPAIGTGASSSTGSLTVNYSGTTTDTFSGSLGDSNATRAANNFSLTKSGTGTLILAGSNSYSGGTTIKSGALLANSTNSTGSGQVTVNSGGALGGTGTIATSGVSSGNAVAIQSGGTLNQSIVSGGIGTSTLTLALNSGSTVNLASGATLAFDLGATGVSDRVDITGGTLTLNGQNFSDFTFTTLSGFTGAGTYDLFSTDGSGNILGVLGTMTGTINGYSATLSVFNSQDLVLTVGAVPEPSTWALMLGSLGLLAFWRVPKRRGTGLIGCLK